MLIVIEGSDFAGKTNVVAELVSKIRTAYPSQCVRASRTSLWKGFSYVVEAAQVSENLPAPLKSFIFHLAYLLDLLWWRSTEHEILVQESYWLRVYAHDLFRKRVFGTLLFSCIGRLMPRPDIAIFLSCPATERRRRYLAFGESNARDDARFFNRYDETVKIDNLLSDLAHRHEYFFVETDTQDADKAASVIMSKSASFLEGHQNVD